MTDALKEASRIMYCRPTNRLGLSNLTDKLVLPVEFPDFNKLIPCVTGLATLLIGTSL